MLVAVLATGTPALAAPARTAITGEWRPSHQASSVGSPEGAAPIHRFDPARLQSFGRPPGGALVLLRPRSGAWPEGPLVLWIGSPGFQRITLLAADGRSHGAHLLEPVRGDRPAHGAVAFDVPVPPQAGAPLRLHVDAGTALPSPMTFEVRSVPAHLRADAGWLAFATACLVTMLVTAVIALFFGLRLRDGAFLYYAAYVVGYAAIQAAQTGYLVTPLQWHAVAASLPVWGRAVTTMSVIAAVLFLDRFTSLDQRLPRTRRWLWAYCGLMLAALVAAYLPVLQAAARQLINPLLILGGPLVLGVAAAAAWRGSRYAALFLVGWVPLLGVTVLGSLQLYGIVAGWTWVADAALAVGALEAIVLSLGLAERAASVRHQRDQALALADIDPLTGVLNRRAWQVHVDALVASAGPRALSVLFLDLDHFKQVNDRIGHDGGDRMLQLFVDVLRRSLRGQDVVGRYGGEEFVVALPDADAVRACAVADRIRADLRTSSPGAGAGVPLTVSVGVATLAPGEPLHSLLRRADIALYAAKERGRDRAVVAELDARPLASAAG